MLRLGRVDSLLRLGWVHGGRRLGKENTVVMLGRTDDTLRWRCVSTVRRLERGAMVRLGRVDSALRLGLVVRSLRLGRVSDVDRLLHLSLEVRLPIWQESGKAHSGAHATEPRIEQRHRPLDLALYCAKAENASNVARVVLYEANQLESDCPRPAHTNKHQTGRVEDDVLLHGRVQGVVVDWFDK